MPINKRSLIIGSPYLPVPAIDVALTTEMQAKSNDLDVFFTAHPELEGILVRIFQDEGDSLAIEEDGDSVTYPLDVDAAVDLWILKTQTISGDVFITVLK